MIYTLTFNPALDYIITVPDYKEGKVNRTASEKILAGGKGINVSTVLSNLGYDNTALGFTAGFTGKVLESMLASLGVKSDFIALDNGFSRINVKIKAEKETEINGQGPKINANAIDMLYNKLDKLGNNDILVLAGSIPNTMPDTIYCDIMERLKDKNLHIIVDATGDLLTNVLKYKPFLIKPNNFELGEIFGKELKNDQDIEECAKELRLRGAENVLVSMGADGALMVTADGRTLRCSAPDGRVVNTTGSGDSTVAGFIAGYLEKRDYEYALKLGICAGSASAFSHNLATKEEIQDVFYKFTKNK